MSDKNLVFLSNVRLSFPHLVEPQKKPDSDKVSYNAEFIMPENHPGWAAFMKKVSEMAVAKWGEHAAAVLQMVNADRKKRCYGNGSEKINGKTFQPYDGYQGNVFITAGRDSRPQIIQADGKPVDPSNTMAYQQLTRQMYGGCRVNVALKPWLQDNKHGKGIRCELIAIQFAGDDTPFGEGPIDASGMFSPVALAEHNTPTPAGMPINPFTGAPVPATPGFTAPSAPAAPEMPPAPFQQPPTVPGMPAWM